VNDALRADALALAVEAEIEDVFIRMLAALLSGGDSSDHSRGGIIIDLGRPVVVLSDWLSLIGLISGFIILHNLGSHSLESLVAVPLVRIDEGLNGSLLGRHNEFFKFTNALRVKRGSLITNLADNALGRWGNTFAVFFFLSSKFKRSAAQSRQRSWLQANMRMSSGIL
jgi:hypothetical protein